ncbi:MAG: hypothetical protein H6536_06885 [Bacteroidales bacterium]|nr:hypothetical protein [Bacteroidales bacterium]
MRNPSKIIALILFVAIAKLGYTQKFYEAETIEQAKLKVYHVEDPKDADLFFCIVYEEKEIKKIGIMMEVANPNEAQIILIFVDDPKLADIKVWLVETPAEVAWKNPDKKKFIVVNGLK